MPNLPTALKTNYKTPQRNRQKDRRYNTGSAIWRRLRKAQLQKHPLCNHCSTAERPIPASEVDHIDGNARNDFQNYQSLCKPCHSAKTYRENGGRIGTINKAQAMPMWIPSPSIPVTVVCGPPASGKTTYIKQHMGERDLVIDLDLIRARLSDKPIYQGGDYWLTKSITMRNLMLESLQQNKHNFKKCWFAVTAPTPGIRSWWKRKLNAEVIIINPGIKECIKRLQADARRPDDVKAVHEKVIHAWH